jgi:hypothetical protein
MSERQRAARIDRWKRLRDGEVDRKSRKRWEILWLRADRGDNDENDVYRNNC